MVTPPEPYDEDSRIELHEVHLPDRRLVYHVEVWHGSHPPIVMKYENIDTLEVYTLCLAPLSRREVATNLNGTPDHEFKVALSPYSTQKAATKLISDVNPHFTGHHSTTHHDAVSVNIWYTMPLESPKDFLFHLHRIQNECSLRYGSTLRAPSAFDGVAVVVEKVAESGGGGYHILSVSYSYSGGEYEYDMNIFEYILLVDWWRDSDPNRPIMGSCFHSVGLRAGVGPPDPSGGEEITKFGGSVEWFKVRRATGTVGRLSQIRSDVQARETTNDDLGGEKHLLSTSYACLAPTTQSTSTPSAIGSPWTAPGMVEQDGQYRFGLDDC
ncbi:hypothetical protein DFH09DRAFT_1081418 [Mycena vulgaris]|nr:hypothetical protein DFH09DRAFT_1081418 [Mycena vulgaris]